MFTFSTTSISMINQRRWVGDEIKQAEDEMKNVEQKKLIRVSGVSDNLFYK